LKIAINICYGGFGNISQAFLNRAVELGWKTTSFDEDDYEISEAQILIDEMYKPGFHLMEENVKRNDPILIQVLEELGKNANERFSEYQVVEIPDNVEWHIAEYDGLEWIAENHQTWN